MAPDTVEELLRRAAPREVAPGQLQPAVESPGGIAAVTLFALPLRVERLETILALDARTGLVQPLWDLTRSDLESAFPEQWTLQAPLVIVVAADLGSYRAVYGSKGRHLATLEAGAYLQLLLGTAREIGLGCCPVSSFADEELARLLDLRDEDVPLVALAAGEAAAAEHVAS